MLRQLRAHPPRRAVLWPVAVAYAICLGAYLTLGDLPSSFAAGDSTSSVYMLLSAAGIAVLVVLVMWHSLWLMPLAAVGFAYVYERSFWTRPADVGSGMDYIGYYPTSILFGMVLAVPYAALVALVLSATAERGRPLHESVR